MEYLEASSTCPLCGESTPHRHTGEEIIKHKNSLKLSYIKAEDHNAYIAWEKEYYEKSSPPFGGWEAWIAAKDYYNKIAAESAESRLREVTAEKDAASARLDSLADAYAAHNSVMPDDYVTKALEARQAATDTAKEISEDGFPQAASIILNALTLLDSAIIKLERNLTAANLRAETDGKDAARYRYLRKAGSKWSSGLFIGMQTATAISQFTDDMADKIIDGQLKEPANGNG